MEEHLDFSQTRRIVLLIDLHPLFDLQNPKETYISSVLASARALLTFSSLSNSLFAFKLFFSSLSPVLSSSKVHSLLGKSSASLSFDRPSQALISLSETLNSLSAISEASISPPRASLTAGSLRQLLHDYAWERRYEDLIGSGEGFRPVRSNLILLFSPVSRSGKCLSEFMGVEVGDESLIDVDAYGVKFLTVFGAVNEGFIGRDIHLCWIDVICQLEYGNGKVEEEGQSFRGLWLAESGIKSLGWGFCSTDAIILGTSLIPFGLIYPMIGASLIDFSSANCGNKAQADLILKISDVGGNPLECKLCGLELFELNLLSKQSVGCLDQLKAFWGNIGHQNIQISIKEVLGKNDSLKLNSIISDFILLREFSGNCGKDQKRDGSDFYLADRVLEMLQIETTEFSPGRAVWQVFLTILYRREYSALVSISNGRDLSLMGILKPFTVHSALLCVLDSKYSTLNLMHDFNGLSSSELQTISEKKCKTPKANTELDNLDGSLVSLQGVLSCKFKDPKKIKKTKSSKLLQDLSWSSFCKAALIQSHVDLEDLYFLRQSHHSKKFRFLKCWMKQTKRSCSSFQMKANETKLQSDIEEAMKQRLTGSEQESEQPASPSFSSGEPSIVGSSDMNGEAAPASCIETSEAFFSSISQKIQQGLESTEVDLGALAERLINSSIYWLYRKHEMDNDWENSTPKEDAEDCTSGMVAAELLKFLLMDPKNLVDKYKSSDLPSLASDSCSAVYASETEVREYELQILFRMEILHSKIGVSIEETAKQKMVKQICSLLENIQCFAGGFFGDFSLDKYVGRTIKSRYSHSLGDVVRKIYRRMDLLLFDDDDGEAPGSLKNSEDGNDTQREKIDENDIGLSMREGTISTTKSMSSQLKKNYVESPQELRDKKRKRSLIEAQERRERARRFASFTSWVPDLQRVWAPKQPRPIKEKSESRKLLKRKDRRRTSCDMVCETPLTAKTRSCTRDSIGTKEQKSCDVSSCCSVSKALFQDDDGMM